jgi:hypothetical protein
LFTGFLAGELDLFLTDWLLISSIVIFIVTCFVYPSKAKRKTGNLYSLQKTCDFILAGTTFLMMVFFGNRETTPLHYGVMGNMFASSSSLPADSNQTYKPISEFKKLMMNSEGKKLKWKERKALLKTQVKGIKAASGMSDLGKTLLIILSVIIALGLLALLSALSCELSCNGSEGGAVIVGVLGTALIVFLTFIVIRSIVRKSKKTKPETKKVPAQGS